MRRRKRASHWSSSRGVPSRAFVAAALWVSLLVGVPVAVAAPLGAGTRVWSIAPGVVRSSVDLVGVSCPSAKSCFAVGLSETAAAPAMAAVEHWDGSHWSKMSSPRAAGSTLAWLNGVSCPSTTSCFAVGGTDTNRSLLEHWDGSGWKIMAAPVSAGAIGVSLFSVSCPSTTSCYAVGLYTTSPETSHGLAEHWDGDRWSTMTIAEPKIGILADDGLSDISCPTTNSCFAVSTVFVNGRSAILVEHWNGNRWSIMRSPTFAFETDLDGVSCPKANSCFVVGRGFPGSDTKTLIEHWNGTRWSVMTSPNRTPDSEVFGVSCPAANSCFAVGDSSPRSSSSTSETLVEHWNGKAWSIMMSPNPKGLGAAGLGRVSCSSANCVALGSEAKTTLDFGATLVEQYR